MVTTVAAKAVMLSECSQSRKLYNLQNYNIILMDIQEVARSAQEFLGEGFSVNAVSDVYVECARNGDNFNIQRRLHVIHAFSDGAMQTAERLARHLNSLGENYSVIRGYSELYDRVM